MAKIIFMPEGADSIENLRGVNTDTDKFTSLYDLFDFTHVIQAVYRETIFPETGIMAVYMATGNEFLRYSLFYRSSRFRRTRNRGPVAFVRLEPGVRPGLVIGDSIVWLVNLSEEDIADIYESVTKANPGMRPAQYVTYDTVSLT